MANEPIKSKFGQLGKKKATTVFDSAKFELPDNWTHADVLSAKANVSISVSVRVSIKVLVDGVDSRRPHCNDAGN